MAWLYLVLAGVFEIAWPLGLKISQNPSRTAHGILLAVVGIPINLRRSHLKMRYLYNSVMLSILVGCPAGPTTDNDRKEAQAVLDQEEVNIFPEERQVAFPAVVKIQSATRSVRAWLQPLGQECKNYGGPAAISEADQTALEVVFFNVCEPYSENANRCQTFEITEPRRVCYNISGDVEIQKGSSKRIVNGGSTVEFIEFASK